MTEAHEMTQAEREERLLEGHPVWPLHLPGVCARADDRPRPHTVVRRLPRHIRQPQDAHHQQEGEKTVSEINADDIKAGDRVTIYRTAESIFAAGLYVSGVALDHGPGSLFVWSDKLMTSTKVSNETTRRIVSHTPAVEQLDEPEPAWEKARVIRTPEGILCRDPKSGWWIDHEGGQWSSSDVDDMDDVTVVVDAEGRNVAADAVTHLLRKTEDEKHEARERIKELEAELKLHEFSNGGCVPGDAYRDAVKHGKSAGAIEALESLAEWIKGGSDDHARRYKDATEPRTLALWDHRYNAYEDVRDEASRRAAEIGGRP